jgi:AAT family amino acid transporter
MLAYIIGSSVIYLIMRALGEIAVKEPVSGSFSAHARKFIRPRAGFMVVWSYWFLWSISSMFIGLTYLTALYALLKY